MLLLAHTIYIIADTAMMAADNFIILFLLWKDYINSDN